MYAMTAVFTMPEGTNWGAMRALARERAEAYYLDMPGLISKAFIIDPERRLYGGQYVWETRAAMDAFLASAIFRGAVAKFGQPEFRFYEIPAYIERGALVGAGR
jgi:hypothetical protein